MAQDEQDEPPLRLANGRFAKGHKQIGHREKGTPNKTTRDVREWLLSAAEAIGADGKGKDGGRGFVEAVGRERAEALLMGLLKLLPQAKPEPAEPVNPASSIFLNVVVESVPSGRYLTEDSIAALRPDKLRPLLVDDVINTDDSEPEPAA